MCFLSNNLDKIKPDTGSHVISQWKCLSIDAPYCATPPWQYSCLNVVKCIHIQNHEIFWILANTRQVTSFRQTILRGRRETWYHNRHTHKCTDRQTGPILYPRPLTLEGTKPQCHSVNIDASWLSERIIDHKTGRQCTRYVLPSVHGRWLVANWLYWGSNIGISIHNQWSNP